MEQPERDYRFLQGAYEQAVCDYNLIRERNAELLRDRDTLQAELTRTLDELAPARRVLAHLSPEVLERAARASDYDAEWYHQAGKSDDAETRHADATALRQAAEEMER